MLSFNSSLMVCKNILTVKHNAVWTSYPLALNCFHSYAMYLQPLIPTLPVTAFKPVLKLAKLLSTAAPTTSH